VIRSGIGIYYDVVPRDLTMGGVPFVLNEEPFDNPADNPAVILPTVFPAPGAAGPSSVSLPAAVNPNLQIPYSMQYSFTVEHARWDTGFRLSYIGTNTRQGDYAYNYNSPVPDDQFFVDKARPFPQYPGITYITNGAGHQFHSFTAEVERRMARGCSSKARGCGRATSAIWSAGSRWRIPSTARRERSVWPDVPDTPLHDELDLSAPLG
jgi:hypothetical protein